MITYSKIKRLREVPTFTVNDLADIFGIRQESASVLCSRYVKEGIFIRLKRNFYILDERWEHSSKEDILRISNFLQVPSYISFMTALSLYEVTTQVQRGIFESACIRHSISYNIRLKRFNYYKLDKRYYSHFIKDRDIFIASKEKAFIDSIYLYSLGRYSIDINSLNIDKLERDKIEEIVKIFPPKTQRIIKRLCRI
ncbi:MAG: hypothetical protein ACE5EA_03155 [Nitrospirota bacterium]